MNISVIPPSHILLNPSLSAQTKLNGCLNNQDQNQILTDVNDLVQNQDLTVSPAPTRSIIIAPLLTNASILTWCVTIILSVQGERTRTSKHVMRKR